MSQIFILRYYLTLSFLFYFVFIPLFCECCHSCIIFSYVSDLSKKDPGSGLKRFNMGEAVLGAGIMGGGLLTAEVTPRLWHNT